MDILFLNHNVAWRGGTFYRAYHVARHLVRRGHSVTLLTISADRRIGFGREVKEGVSIVHSPDLLWGSARTGWDPWGVLNRIAYLRGKDWDIVHAWDSRPAVILPALFACGRTQCRAKLVIDWCDWWGRGGTQAERQGIGKVLYSPIETYFEERFRTRADATTVISSALSERARRLGVPADSILMLPQGCDVEDVSVMDRQAARSDLGLPAGMRLVLSVGTLTSSEAALLFSSVKSLGQGRHDFRVIMIGNHKSRIPPDLKAAGLVVETGFVSDGELAKYIAACDALVATLTNTIASRARWPSKVNPFLAAGRAVVITRVGDLAHLLEREQAAAVADCDPWDIASKLNDILDGPNLRMKCESRGRQVAERILAWPIVVDKLEQVYVRLGGST